MDIKETPTAKIKRLEQENADMRIVIADLAEALYAMGKYKNLPQKITENWRARQSRGGKFWNAMMDLKHKKQLRDQEENGDEKWFGRSDRINKGFLETESETQKIREIIEDPKIKITAGMDTFATDKRKPTQLTSVEILHLLGQLRDLNKK
jgi:hypothetical protein